MDVIIMVFHVVELGNNIFEKNNKLALENRKKLHYHNVFSINIMGAIGSGKTTLIEYAIKKLKSEYNIGVIAGDIVADMDASRFSKYDIPTVPANTGKECHLDANIISNSLSRINLKNIDLLFMENVGNLICPVDFDLGEDIKIVIVSVTEGDDIILKHPYVFQIADIAIINKIDVAKYVDSNPEKMKSDIEYLNPNIPILLTSKNNEESMEQWINMIKKIYLDKMK